jgi:hypothetical protein
MILKVLSKHCLVYMLLVEAIAFGMSEIARPKATARLQNLPSCELTARFVKEVYDEEIITQSNTTWTEQIVGWMFSTMKVISDPQFVCPSTGEFILTVRGGRRILNPDKSSFFVYLPGTPRPPNNVVKLKITNMKIKYGKSTPVRTEWRHSEGQDSMVLAP